jgi:hypothetical protein
MGGAKKEEEAVQRRRLGPDPRGSESQSGGCRYGQSNISP